MMTDEKHVSIRGAQGMDIVLIGMPASGKSTVGVVLAKYLGMDFIDTDLALQSACGQRLSEIISGRGREGFLKAEEQVLTSLRAENTVIATGGSAVYSGAAMAHLKQIGRIVYLDISRDTFKARLKNARERGVVLREGQDLDGLYDERAALYRRWAEVTVREDGLTLEETVRRVIDQTRIRAVFTDLDGTLMRSDKTVSDETARRLRALAERGVLIAAATARPERVLSKLIGRVPFGALITLNGARVRIGEKDAAGFGIPAGEARAILQRLLSLRGTALALETDAGIAANIPIPEWGVPEASDLEKTAAERSVYKILAFGQGHRLKSVALPGDFFPEPGAIGALLSASLPDTVYHTIAEGWLFQIMSREASKWNGVRAVLKARGLEPSEALYFGDDADDVEALGGAGIGVAMGNAIPRAKEAAKCLAPSSDLDGVSMFLRSAECLF